MLKRFLLSALQKRGYTLKRLPHSQAPINPRYDAEDQRAIIQAIDNSAQYNTPDKNGRPWYHNYCSPRRLSFYHDVIDQIEKHVGQTEGKRLLEIGSFFGVMARFFRQRNPNCEFYGVEIDARHAAVSRIICPEAHFEQGSLFSLPLEGPFDIVVMTEVLEHILNPLSAVQRLLELAPAGTILLTVPDGRHDSTPAREFSEEFQSYRGHVNFWSPESWQQFLRHAAPDRRVETEVMATGHLSAAILPPGDRN